MRFLDSCQQFRDCVGDLIDTPVVQSMKNYIQHSNVSTLEHSVFVAYVSFCMCRFFRLDYQSAARGGLLHDLFLYDWHSPERKGKLHGLTHPATALENACRHFDLNRKERDIIKKHMWPITLSLPRYWESLAVCMADKFCAMCEVMGINKRVWVQRIMELQELQDRLAEGLCPALPALTMAEVQTR